MRFVILHHTGWPGRTDHYDLMLQTAAGKGDDDRVLRTFSTMADDFPIPPATLIEIPPHRRAFLTFEGPLSENRGVVQRVDEGEYSVGDGTLIHFMGKKLNGRYQLRPAASGKFILERES